MRFRFACRQWFIDNILAAVLHDNVDDDSARLHGQSPTAID
jgi:hypothetical protein